MKKPLYRFAKRTQHMSGSVIREILKISSRPGVISFAGGMPAPETFPLTAFRQAIADTLRLDGARALQYFVTEGHPALKSYLSTWLKTQGIRTRPEEMLLTHGSQQALDLLGKIFISPGEAVAVEDPTYLGAIQSWNAYQARYLTIPGDDAGMRMEELEKRLDRTPVRFIYVVPTFQNPSGITWSLARRKALLGIARERRIPIIEDDPYSVLRFRGEAVPSLFALSGGKGVVYLSTFSKLLSPGIRLGFVCADPEVIRQLVFAKQAADLQTNTFIQYAVYHYCRRGALETHIPALRRDYARRAGVMLDALRAHVPPEVAYGEPEGGMFVWCRFPAGVRAKRVFQEAVKNGVAFVEGSVFFANGGGENTARLNFTNSSDQSIRTGVRRLAKVLKDEIAKRS